MKNKWSIWKVILIKWPQSLVFLLLIGVILFAIYSQLRDSPLDASTYIAIAAFAISVITFVIPLFEKPILRVEVEKKAIFSRSTKSKEPSSWFHRLLVFNDGVRPAENCVGKLIEIRNSHGQKITKFDPLPFFWSHQNRNIEFRPVTIFGTGDYAIIDILQEKVDLQRAKRTFAIDTQSVQELEINDLSNELPALRIYQPSPEKLAYQELDSDSPGETPVIKSGIYYVKIGIYAENGFAKPTWYKLEINLSSKEEIASRPNPQSKSRLSSIRPNDVPKSDY